MSPSQIIFGDLKTLTKSDWIGKILKVSKLRYLVTWWTTITMSEKSIFSKFNNVYVGKCNKFLTINESPTYSPSRLGIPFWDFVKCINLFIFAGLVWKEYIACCITTIFFSFSFYGDSHPLPSVAHWINSRL